MMTLFKYIVFFIFCFNISGIKAAEVILDLEDDDTVYNDSLPFVNSVSLPHAADMRRILDSSDNSTTGNLMILGKYFDEKYPGDAINLDFSNDIAQIFPELSQQEIYDRTKKIRQAVNLYRWGKNKYSEIKADLLAPKEPPLIVNEDDYDHPELYQYVEVEDGKFAIMYDFKKVLSYGTNPRDLQAMEARRQNMLNLKKNKTNFEKFKSMVSKLEFSKIPFYGITEPNPFVGNAGIGSWQEANGFKARLISEAAEIAGQEHIRMGVHVDVPNHRFMLAENYGSNLNKPKFEILASKNVKSYQFFYPLPLKIAYENMLGGYAGDFAFPLEITPQEPNQPIEIKARLSFESCDAELDCQRIELYPELELAAGTDNISSSLKNFIKQSFYSLPPAQSKYIKQVNAGVTLSPDGKSVQNIRLNVEYNGSPDQFSLFLEDNIGTIFARPHITIDRDKIYLNIIPLTNQHQLTSSKITAAIRLNTYASWRDDIVLKPIDKLKQTTDYKTFSQILLLAFWAGVLFTLMPLGFPFISFQLMRSESSSTQSKRKNIIRYCLAVFAAAGVFAFAAVYGQSQGKFLAWGMQYQNLTYMMIVIFILLAMGSILKSAPSLLKINASILSIYGGIAAVLMAPFSSAPFLDMAANFALRNSSMELFAVFYAAGAGMCLPYLALYLILAKKSKLDFSEKINVLLRLLSMVFISITVAYLLLILYSQLGMLTFGKLLLLLLIGWLMMKYCLNFLQALDLTDLSSHKKSTARQAIVMITAAVCGFLAWTAARWAPRYQSITTFINQNEINQKIEKGQNVLLALEPDWCLLCQYNKLTVLNKRTIERWQKLYNISYIPVTEGIDSPEGQAFLHRYGKAAPPLYILYNLNLDEGLILPVFLSSGAVENMLQDFEI